MSPNCTPNYYDVYTSSKVLLHRSNGGELFYFRCKFGVTSERRSNYYSNEHGNSIRITYPCKIGIYRGGGGIHNFLIFAQNIRCGYTLEPPQLIFLFLLKTYVVGTR